MHINYPLVILTLVCNDLMLHLWETVNYSDADLAIIMLMLMLSL